ncbi:hypothetical protein BT69DRAFT_1333956 [Atractiella rhizophila]|nr:hypothetical protein BT69DRAFT_1333956 [Atractiella rhizophila]
MDTPTAPPPGTQITKVRPISMEEGTEHRHITPPPTFVVTAPSEAPSNKRKADDPGFTPNKQVAVFTPVARYQQLTSRIEAESPPILVSGLHPKAAKGRYRGLAEKVKFQRQDWQNERTIKGFMQRLYKELLPDSDLRYHVVNRPLQFWGNVTQRDSLKMDGMVTSIKFKPSPVYSSAVCGVEVKTGEKSQTVQGKRQLGRGAVYPLVARPRHFFWGLLVDGALDKKKYCWIVNAHGGRWQSDMQGLEENYQEFLEGLATLVEGDEKETGFLDIFDHDSSLSPPSQLGFKLDLEGRLKDCQVVGTGFRSNLVAEGLFQKCSITGSGTQVWACRFVEGTGYGIIKHVWLDKTLLARMKDTVEHFIEWRQKLEEGSLDCQRHYWEWLEHAPRVLLSFPEFSTSKIFEKCMSWDEKKQPEFEKKELVPVLIFHSTIGLPLGAATNLDEVLNTFIGLLRQLATLNDQDFVHRDVSYTNIFMHKWTPEQKETGTTIGWLNDFDFSINNSKPGDTGFAAGESGHDQNDHVEISGTFIFLSRCALQAVLDFMYPQSNEMGDDEVSDEGTVMDDNKVKDQDNVGDHASDTEDDTAENNKSPDVKPSSQPPKLARPLYRQNIMDDVESVLFCMFYFFCHFVPQKRGRTGPFRKRTWHKRETSMAQDSGKIYSNKDPSFIFGVEPLLQDDPYPLAAWEEAINVALDAKLMLLYDGMSQEDFNKKAAVLLGAYDEDWNWNRKKVLAVLWEVSQPLWLNPADIGKANPFSHRKCSEGRGLGHG